MCARSNFSEKTKTVYPTSDPEFSRRLSQNESPVSGTNSPPMPHYGSVTMVYDKADLEAPPPAVMAQDVADLRSGRQSKQTLVSSRVETPVNDACTPVDGSGKCPPISFPLTSRSSI